MNTDTYTIPEAERGNPVEVPGLTDPWTPWKTSHHGIGIANLIGDPTIIRLGDTVNDGTVTWIGGFPAARGVVPGYAVDRPDGTRYAILLSRGYPVGPLTEEVAR